MKLLILSPPICLAAAVCVAQPITLPNVLSNSTVADANAVQANLQAIVDGVDELIRVTEDRSNIAIGPSALASDTGSQNSTAIGSSTLAAFSSSFDNTAIGHEALSGVSQGSRNTAVGSFAHRSVNGTTGSMNFNTAVGYKTLFSNTEAPSTRPLAPKLSGRTRWENKTRD